MKIYTRTGDDGQTQLLGPGRVSKHHARIEAYGAVDELNAALGLAQSEGQSAPLTTLVASIQSDLFSLGAALADPDPNGPFHHAIQPAHVARLEHAIDSLEASLPKLTQFILPGGTRPAALLHVARTVCRRAERRVVALAQIKSEHVPETAIIYLNRLSDLLFVMARAANHQAGVVDVPWAGPSAPPPIE